MHNWHAKLQAFDLHQNYFLILKMLGGNIVPRVNSVDILAVLCSPYVGEAKVEAWKIYQGKPEFSGRNLTENLTKNFGFSGKQGSFPSVVGAGQVPG